MENLLDRFLRYVKVNTRSNDQSTTVPSTPSQTAFLNTLKQELIDLGMSNVRTHPTNAYVLATLPANTEKQVPTIGLLAHVDTADFNADGVNPQVVENYAGGAIQLGDSGYQLDPTEFPSLNQYHGQTLITTDGTTLLGADDKAGVAEIMTLMEYLLAHPEIKHGTIQVGFGPDEEIGTGADHFDVADFDADFAYTVDGGPMGQLEYETFNAAQATLKITGKNVHTATAKDTMVNALQLAVDYQSALAAADRPELTDGRDGFYHLYKLNGTVDEAEMQYIIRDFDPTLFAYRKRQMQLLADQMNAKLDTNRIQVTVKDQYYNLKQFLDGKMESVDLAKAAMEQLDITPDIEPVRGGTDGSKISALGLPTPNLFAGGENMHSRFEYVSLQTMEAVIQVLLKINELNVQQ
ncbi:peptidase T [Limosilactobacillus equigenerosi]|uniref:Peptidase T n=1 Tax=Limosilactobacillus equigenerosi DSM 18793 = JCM 14505 TaxID=1423742 RepID=A0A0R1UNR0_9LACO|nr:peptidase T [Limosilactobacillus equigenerosi]KRL92613.1 Peptidase T [Limosilactobacillus equigenerosi DSM 18793 = JCM 14505]